MTAPVNARLSDPRALTGGARGLHCGFDTGGARDNWADDNTGALWRTDGWDN